MTRIRIAVALAALPWVLACPTFDEDARYACDPDGSCPGTQVCDADSGWCVACVEDAHCGPNASCEAFTCVATTASCASSDDCTGPGAEHCDPDSAACVACVGDEHCSDGEACVDLECVPITTHCASSDDCTEAGAEHCEDGAGVCVACLERSHCGADEICLDFECVAAPSRCTSSDDCTTPGAEQCDTESGRCVACLENDHCDPGLVCAEPLMTCVAEFSYAVSNVAPADVLEALASIEYALEHLSDEAEETCALSTDAASMGEVQSCFGMDVVLVQASQGETEVAILPVSSLSLSQETSVLRAAGELPLAILVFGDATVAGALDVSADLEGPAGVGAAAGALCDESRGLDGLSGSRASGGGGGGFGGAGGAGIRYCDATPCDEEKLEIGGPGGAASELGATPSPLRAGCAGGRGCAGNGVDCRENGGVPGGALQLSVAGDLVLTGSARLAALGGGGAAGQPFVSGLQPRIGGGGGGSGGMILVEARTLVIEPGVRIVATGGGGGMVGGNGSMASAETPCTGGAGAGVGGTGGVGGIGGSNGDGGDGRLYVHSSSGATGGGGGTGRTYLRWQLGNPDVTNSCFEDGEMYLAPEAALLGL